MDSPKGLSSFESIKFHAKVSFLIYSLQQIEKNGDMWNKKSKNVL